MIASRIGLQIGGKLYERGTDIRAEVEEELKKRKLHCILLDEAQFLTRAQVVQLASICDELDIPVLAYGLRTDFQANLFEGSAHLLALADTLVELKAVCECGRKATMNLRVDEDGPRGEPGRNRPRSAATTATSRSAAAISWSGSPRWRASSCASRSPARRERIEAEKAASHILHQVRGGFSWSARFSPPSRSSPAAASKCRPRRPSRSRRPRSAATSARTARLTGRRRRR